MGLRLPLVDGAPVVALTEARRVFLGMLVAALCCLALGLVLRAGGGSAFRVGDDAGPTLSGPPGSAVSQEGSDEGSPPPSVAPGPPTLADRESAGLRPLAPAAGVPTTLAPGPVPARMTIGAIGVHDAPVAEVGAEADGALEVPPATVVGWYRFGGRPGGPGSTVLAAHIAYDGVDGVFRHLADLRPGGEVRVTLDDGTEVAYEVRDVVEYAKEVLPVDEIFAETGPHRLVLVTCGGRFNPELRSYDSNVVAVAVPAPPPQPVPGQ